MKTQSTLRHGARPPWPIILGLALWLVASALPAFELTCEKGENQEGGCCCFFQAHTYSFEPVAASKVHVTFDTGRGIGCSSRVEIQILIGSDWRTVETVDTVSSSGRTEINRVSGTLMIGGTISGVRFDDGGRCYMDYSKVGIETGGVAPEEVTTDLAPAAGPPAGLPAGADKPGLRLVADPPPPYPDLPVTIEFAAQPAAVAGAVWWLDGRKMTNAEIFFWTFGDAGDHRVSLRSSRGDILAEYPVRVSDPRAELPAAYRLSGKRGRGQGAGAGVQSEIRELELDRSAAVTRVEGNAGSYCIWTVAASGSLDQRVLCSKQGETVVGAILLPGRYLVLPDLDEAQRSSEVTIFLQPR